MTDERRYPIETQIFDAIHEQHTAGKNLCEVLIAFLDGIARAECKFCRYGDPPRRLPKGSYSHRVHEGRNKSLINIPCRATEIRKEMADIESRMA